MKAPFKTYAVVGFGIVAAHQPFVNAEYVKLISASKTESGATSAKGLASNTESGATFERGLEVNISPSLKIIGRKWSTEPETTYNVELDVKDRTPSVRSSAWNCFYSVWPNYKPLSRTEAPSGLEKSGITDGWEIDDHVSKSFRERFQSGTYTTRWELRDVDLNEWIKAGWLHVSKTSRLNVQAYIERYPGIYSFRSKKDGEYDLVFGKINHKSFLFLIRDHDFQSADASILGEWLHTQNVRFNLDIFKKKESTSPNDLCGQAKLEKEKPRERLEVHQLEEIRRKLILGVVFGMYVETFTFENYVVKRDDRCTLNYMRSSDKNTWGLGLTFLRTYNLVIDTTDEKLTYRYERKMDRL